MLLLVAGTAPPSTGWIGHTGEAETPLEPANSYDGNAYILKTTISTQWSWMPYRVHDSYMWCMKQLWELFSRVQSSNKIGAWKLIGFYLSHMYIACLASFSLWGTMFSEITPRNNLWSFFTSVTLKSRMAVWKSAGYCPLSMRCCVPYFELTE